jgi:hypothetical protein
MSFQYPAKPWVDGQEIKINFQGKEVVVAKYDASKNLWMHLRVNDAGKFQYVSSCDVILNRDCSDPCLPNIEWENIDNLQTALDYLYYWLFDESNGAIPRLDRLEGKVEDLEDLYNQLLQIINNLGGLQDLENLLITLQQIVETLADHEERIKALEAQLPVYGGGRDPVFAIGKGETCRDGEWGAVLIYEHYPVDWEDPRPDTFVNF